MLAFLNGKILPEAEAVVPLNDRGFLLGDGLFETVRVANGRPFRFAQHLDRLSRGADFLKIRLPFATREIEKFAAQLIERNRLPECVLRLTLTRGAGARGYSIIGADNPTLAMVLHPLPEVLNEPMQWDLVTSPLRIPADDPLAAFKTTSKILNVLARAEAEQRGADEALLLNAHGDVAETAGGNIFWVCEDLICTVPAGHGVLPGITRAVVLEICQAHGLKTGKRVIRLEQLLIAEGVFVTQTALGIIPVASIDGKLVTPSPLVEQIAVAYNEMLSREHV
jgi:aminodeoxychorismate lyase